MHVGMTYPTFGSVDSETFVEFLPQKPGAGVASERNQIKEEAPGTNCPDSC